MHSLLSLSFYAVQLDAFFFFSPQPDKIHKMLACQYIELRLAWAKTSPIELGSHIFFNSLVTYT